jgi:hypothetical protein
MSRLASGSSVNGFTHMVKDVRSVYPSPVTRTFALGGASQLQSLFNEASFVDFET